MKKMLLIFIAVFVFGCTEKSDGVKIIDNYDEEYLTEKQVDNEAGTEEELKLVMKDIKQIVHDEYSKLNSPIKAVFNYRLYIDEEGRVDGIKQLPISEKYSTEDGSYKLIDKELLLKEFADAAKSWKFTAATKENNPVKFRGDLELILTVDETGTIKEEIPSLKSLGNVLSKLKFTDDDIYFVVVEEQPEPIGGLMAIQEKIVYPKKAKEAGIQGRVFVKAFINEEGIVDKVELLKGFDPECDSVAMNAIKQTKFTSPKQRGEPVKVQVAIPIVFKLQ
ncbi:MAG: energy transducer TonB [Melioribacteraceae bacterium]|nr:energy transducer TonB [Melioribacteraceae bacterium]